MVEEIDFGCKRDFFISGGSFGQVKILVLYGRSRTIMHHMRKCIIRKLDFEMENQQKREGMGFEMISRVHRNKLRESNYRRVQSCEVKSCEVKSCEVKSCEVKSCVVKSCVVKSCEVKSCEVKSCEVKSYEVKQFQGEEWKRKDIFGYINDVKQSIICTILILLLLRLEHDHHIDIPIFLIPFHMISYYRLVYHIISCHVILQYTI